MGYELHITKAEFWAENKGHEICSHEWLVLIDGDPELTLDSRNGPFFAVSKISDNEQTGWLDWHEGNISSKNPDRALLSKMLQVADALGATVQGDDGETYSSIEDLREIGPEVRDAAGRLPWLPGLTRREQIRNLLIYLIIAIVIIVVNVFDIW